MMVEKLNNMDEIDSKKEIINTLITKIFGNSYCNCKSENLEIRSYDKFEKDIFYLDCARFELEMALIKCGFSVDKYYDFKYKQTDPNDEEYRSFSYSLGALITIWKNFCQETNMFKKAFVNFFEESFEIFVDRLEKVNQIVCNGPKDLCLSANSIVALQ